MNLETLARAAIVEWQARLERGEISQLECREGIRRIREAQGDHAPERESRGVLRWQLQESRAGIEGASRAGVGPWVVMADDYDALARQLASCEARIAELENRLGSRFSHLGYAARG